VLLLCWTAGLFLFDAASFTGHMVVHMGIVVVAAPLVAIAIAGSGYGGPAWLSPIPMSFVELVVVWAWHMPTLRELAETSLVARALEQGTFLAAGILLWLSCLAGRGRKSMRRRLSGVFALLLTSMHMTLLGVLLTMAPRPLYGEGEVTCLGFVLTAEQDQQSGGVIMLMLGAVAYLVGGLALFRSAMEEPGEDAGRRPV
jgi:putative membrane protein